MIAKVAFPVSISGIYDYKIPEKLISEVIPGVPVKVDLRNRVLWGVVVKLAEKSKINKLKNIIGVKPKHWSESCGSIIRLYEWISAYYQTDMGKVFKPMIRKGIVDLEPKTVPEYRFSGIIKKKLTRKQREIAESLRDLMKPLLREEVCEKYGITDYMLSLLVSNNVLEKKERQVIRESLELFQKPGMNNVTLTEEQRLAVETIWKHFSSPTKPFLLYGVTGSGKTHVYIELVKRVLDKGKRAIILVPEISLTPQTIKHFRDAVGSDIAVIHSRMSNGERRDSIEDIVSGRKRIVIGVRSAILVPMNNVGLILVDEEHDASYKQSDPEPRYNARDVAVMRGKYQKALVVLGSATPCFETYQNSLCGKYQTVKLTERFGEAALPEVKIIDMNEEHRQNNWTFISRHLRERIRKTLDGKKQIILLLNRRGFSVSLICKDCGHKYECPNCSVNLIYHRTEMALKCHQCGHKEEVPEECPVCKGEQIKYRGTGIQKAESYLGELFPDAKILRMDQDTTRRKGAHISILETFAEGKVDILLGTQMVAKGLNFPNVRLVGVLQADTGLHFPDFRASEKTFQLLAQVAGRAGRKDSLGEVVIQTYSPDEPGVSAARTHDYVGFFNEEIKSRRILWYPPFSKLHRIIIQGDNEKHVKSVTGNVASFIRRTAGNSVGVLGPAPAVLAKIKGLYRYNILVKSESPGKMQHVFARIKNRFTKLPKKMKLIIDVDPVNML